MDLQEQPPIAPRREPVFNLPPAVTVLVGLLIGIHLLRTFILPPEVDWEIVRILGFIPADIFSAPVEGGEVAGLFVHKVVPFVSYGLLHGDIFHLGFNSIWLIALGSPVERRLGAFRFSLLVWAGTVLSAVFYGLIHPSSEVPMIGASGAISAMMGALVRLMFAIRRGTATSRLADPGLIGFAAIWMALNVVSGIAGIGGVGAQVQSIAWEAHIGGFLTGLFLLPFLDRPKHGRRLAPPLPSRNEDR